MGNIQNHSRVCGPQKWCWRKQILSLCVPNARFKPYNNNNVENKLFSFTIHSYFHRTVRERWRKFGWRTLKNDQNVRNTKSVFFIHLANGWKLHWAQYFGRVVFRFKFNSFVCSYFHDGYRWHSHLFLYSSQKESDNGFPSYLFISLLLLSLSLSVFFWGFYPHNSWMCLTEPYRNTDEIKNDK